MKEYIDFVKKELGEAELLCQLAEELSELSVAARIMRCASYRYGHDRSVMLKSYEYYDVLEEIADVSVLVDMLYLSDNDWFVLDDEKERKVLNGIGIETELEDIEMKCIPLIKRVLKLRRAVDGKNPTPITKEEAKQVVVDGLVEIEEAICSIVSYADKKQIADTQHRKMQRWTGRIKENRAKTGRKYRAKAEVVEAFQFDGDLMDANGNYYVPDWAVDELKKGNLFYDAHFTDGGVPPFCVKINDGSWVIFPEYWVVRHKSGRMEVMNPRDFKLIYEVIE